MNALSKNKVLLTIITVLLLTNITLLILLLQSKRHQRKEPQRVSFIDRLKNEVGFTEMQLLVYSPKRETFWDEMRKRLDEVKKNKQEFYSQMYDSTVTDSVLEKRAEVIGDLQKELDLFVIRHFQDVRKICTPEQLPKYDSIMPGIIKRMIDPVRKK